VDAKLINEAMLRGLEVEIWRVYEPQFGRGSRIAVELMGSRRIVRQTQYDIILDDGMHYPLKGSDIRIKQK